MILEVTQVLFLAAEDLARGTAHVASIPFLLATMTTFQKRDGGVRGIVAGTTFRRLVAKVLARQFGLEVEKVCSPFQLPSRQGQARIVWGTRFEQSPTTIPGNCSVD